MRYCGSEMFEALQKCSVLQHMYSCRVRLYLYLWF